MDNRFDALGEFLRALAAALARLAQHAGQGLRRVFAGGWRRRGRLAAAAVIAALAYALYAHPPFATVHAGETLVLSDDLDGTARAYSAGTVLVLPGIEQVHRYPVRDQIYRADENSSATGPSPFQSVEGLSIGVDLTVRWAIDRTRVAQLSKEFPDDIDADLVRPAVQGVVYPILARHSVREIFSRDRTRIREEIIAQLQPKLWAVGLLLRGVDVGKVDLPPDYRAGMEKLLEEELATEKVRYTLELKEANVKETQLEAEAEKVKRQKEAEAAGEAQVIAARAQEETMRHILPFKQKQIQQRRLEAEAEKVARIRTAEGAAEARRIEARGEADSRQKLADAEAYRLDLVGKANAGQMEREGALIARYPLLIQKTLADKLSDKVQVIIAPTPPGGGFIGSNLVGTPGTGTAVQATMAPLSARGERAP